jgi:hypothetical protein
VWGEGWSCEPPVLRDHSAVGAGEVQPVEDQEIVAGYVIHIDLAMSLEKALKVFDFDQDDVAEDARLIHLTRSGCPVATPPKHGLRCCECNACFGGWWLADHCVCLWLPAQVVCVCMAQLLASLWCARLGTGRVVAPFTMLRCGRQHVALG